MAGAEDPSLPSDGLDGAEKPQRARQRKEHTKSRGGCITCKQRHMRCDQRKPMCMNCLVRSGDCGYPVEQPKVVTAKILLPKGLLIQSSPIQVTSLSTFDPFGCLPMQNNRRNSELFHFYNDFHSMVCTTGEGLVHVGAVVEDLTHMKIILLMASVRRMSLSRSSSGPNSDTYLACKLDTIQDANKLLAHPARFAETMVGAWIIGSLLTVESACGDIKAARTHARGLVAMRAESPLPSSVWGLLERNLLIRTALFAAANRAATKESTSTSSSTPRGPSPSTSPTTSLPPPPSPHPIPITHRPRALLLPTAPARSASAWSLILYIYCHLVVGLGSNPRVPVDHELLRWMLDAPCADTAACTGEVWMWKQAAGLYCLVVASAHPVVEAWARLPVGGDGDGLVGVRRWFDGLLRPEGRGGGCGVAEVAERFLDWATTQAVIDKLAWLEEEEGRKLATRLWRDAVRQPYGLISVS